MVIFRRRFWLGLDRSLMGPHGGDAEPVIGDEKIGNKDTGNVECGKAQVENEMPPNDLHV